MKFWKNNINISYEAVKDYSYERYKSYERFGFVKNIMQKRLRRTGDFLDIGCAKGEFICYLKSFYPEIDFTGIDISDKLIRLARREPKLRDVKFIRTDAQKFNLNRKFDFVLMSGVLAIFDDYRQLLNRMARHIKLGGWGYIFGYFTEEDIDVLVRYRNNYLGSKVWESGLNMFSLITIRRALGAFSDHIKFYKFHLSKDLAKKKNPILSYTLNTREKGKIVLNGANILNQFYLVEFRNEKYKSNYERSQGIIT